MFTQLPATLQHRILFLLSINNFPEAKALYDNWQAQVYMDEQSQKENASEFQWDEPVTSGAESSFAI